MSPRTKPTLPIDIYCRVSQTGGRDVEAEGGTLDDQEKRCRAQLEASGYAVGKVFKDKDKSGKDTSRPAFDQAKQRMADGLSGGLVVLNLSRFGRNREVAKDIIAIEEAGCTVISVDEKLDTSTPTGRFALDILTAVNTLYLENVTAAWERVHADKINAGIQSSPAPIGYVRDEATKKFVPDPATAPLVQEIFRRRVGGESVRSVAAYLTEHDPEGRTWSPSAVRKVLANPTYLGTVRFGNHVKEDAHPALLDARTFRLAQAESRKTGGKRPDGPILGGGLLRCGVPGCGMALVKSTGTGSNGQRYDFLRCSSEKKGHASMSFRRAIPPVVDEAVRRARAYLDANPIQPVAKPVPQDLLDDLAQVEADLHELQRALDAGQIKGLAFSLPYQQAEDDRERLLREIDEAAEGEPVYSSEDDRFARQLVTLLHSQHGAETWNAEFWEKTPPEETALTRKMLKRFLGSVTVLPGKGDPRERIVFQPQES